jgi:hypothetical protein
LFQLFATDVVDTAGANLPLVLLTPVSTTMAKFAVSVIDTSGAPYEYLC